MIGWPTILVGAAMSAVVAAVLVGLVSRSLACAAVAALAAAAGPIAWNAILRATHASQFFTDAPIAAMPASWQDTGSAVFGFAAAAILLGLGPARATAPPRVIGLAAVVALAAFLVDVYLY